MDPRGRLGIAPGIASLANAFVLLLRVAGDFRVLRSGPLTGTRRLARHLWRMCYAMFTATGSFFLGQPQVIPEPLRITPLILVLAFLPLPAMVLLVVARTPASAKNGDARSSPGRVTNGRLNAHQLERRAASLKQEPSDEGRIKNRRGG